MKFRFKVNAPVDGFTAATATTMHWFAQIGHNLNENDECDSGEGKTLKKKRVFQFKIK